MSRMRERHSSPFGYVGPALIARQMSDLAAPRKALEITKKERVGEQSINGEALAGTGSLLKALERSA